MPFYSFEMMLVGIILLSAMTAGGIKLWIKRRQNTLEQVKDDSKQQNIDSS
jgi:hypothetical protein